MTPAQREHASSLRASGASYPAIGRALNVSTATAYRLVTGATSRSGEQAPRQLSMHRKFKSSCKTRPCMCCERLFFSEGIHNRLCDDCKTRG